MISSTGALCAICRANPTLTPTPVHRVSLTWACCPPMVVPAPRQLQGTTNHEATAGEGQPWFRHCGLNLLKPEPEAWSSHKSVQSETSRCSGCFNELVSNRAVLVHYTALWVLNCDPSTGRDMTLLQSARDVIHVHPWGSTQHMAVPAEPRASRLSHAQ